MDLCNLHKSFFVQNCYLTNGGKCAIIIGPRAVAKARIPHLGSICEISVVV